jgi:hypothetical protein
MSILILATAGILKTPEYGCLGCRRGVAALVLVASLVSLLSFEVSACADFRSASSSQWSIQTSAKGAVLMTPCGEPFFSLGVNGVDRGDLSASEGAARGYRWERFAASPGEWAATARRRLLEWGFNTAGAWSLAPSTMGLPSTPELELGRRLQFVWTDPFDPSMLMELRRAAADAVAPFRGDPLRIGYFSDNEIGWWNGPLFLTYMAYPPQNHAKQRLVALLRTRYDENWEKFTEDFVPAAGTASFDDLLVSRSPPHLRPGGAGIGAVRAWTGIFAGQYYREMRAALRAADPEALYLGDRLPIYYDPDAVAAMAPYVDAISVNYNVDGADGWVAPYFFNGLRDLSGGKPVLITEWFFAAAENRSGNLNRTGEPNREGPARVSNNRNRTGHLMTVASQTERARGAGRAAQIMAAMPNVIGLHWFQYADEPPGGRADGEDYDFGLVDIDDRPYDELVNALRTSNELADSVARRAATPPDSETGIVLPRADIDPTKETLADWPKSASLVALTPAPSESAFGDVHLAWNEQGLFLATISMDYFDPELLGEIAGFPRSEAFRVSLGIEEGGGPRQIELRVVPKTVVHTSKRETKLSFAVETCWYEQGDDCAPVRGAIAHYFGTALDQPRVILKAFIPWSQLGLGGSPAHAALRLQIGVTAFYRSRWMSTDGVAPEIAMARPDSWWPVKLAEPPLRSEFKSPAAGTAGVSAN